MAFENYPLFTSLDFDINHGCDSDPWDSSNAVRDRVGTIDRHERLDTEDGIEIGLKLSDCLDLLQPVLRACYLGRPDITGLSHADAQDRDHFRLLADLHALVVQ